MQAYYARRAPEYERIYARPERQADLTQLCTVIERAFAGRSVLDVACGTGYFTAHAARYARSVTGIDANEETLVIARAKNLANAVFAVADAYAMPEPREPFDAALVTFWWSHIPRQRIAEFLQGLHRQLAPGAVVVMADNTYVEGNSTPIARTDDGGNTYQTRALENGERHEVLKNFPRHDELAAWGERFGTAVEVRFLTYFWVLQYRLC
jgi:demethylmenaquinone methyltransferase/2-methoxy-6-polyprenyl-1,4-benzoquinol methylase